MSIRVSSKEFNKTPETARRQRRWSVDWKQQQEQQSTAIGDRLWHRPQRKASRGWGVLLWLLLRPPLQQILVLLLLGTGFTCCAVAAAVSQPQQQQQQQQHAPPATLHNHFYALDTTERDARHSSWMVNKMPFPSTLTRPTRRLSGWANDNVPNTRKTVATHPSAPTRSPITAYTTTSTSYPTFQSDVQPLSIRSSNSSTNDTAAEEMASPPLVIVEKLALIRIQHPEGSKVLLSALATHWQNYLQNRLRSVYRSSTEVQLQDVQLQIEGAPINPGEPQSRRHRRLQGSTGTGTPSFVDIQANAQAEFVPRDAMPPLNVANFTEQTETLIKNLLEPPNLQQTLFTSTTLNTLTVVSTSFPSGELGAASTGDDDDDDDDDGPSLLQLIVGFSLLGIVVLSLIFWLYVLYKFRAKRAEERRRTNARKTSTFVMPRPKPPPPHPKSLSRRPPSRAPSTTSILESSSTSEHSGGSRFGRRRRDALHLEYDGGEDYDEEVEEEVDAFAQELEFAASADQESWVAIQREREKMLKDGGAVKATFPSSLNHSRGTHGSTTITAMPTSTTKTGNVDDNDDEQEGEGFELQASDHLTFPYGDDHDDWIQGDDEDEDDPLRTRKAQRLRFMGRRPPSSTRQSRQVQSRRELSTEDANAWAASSVPNQPNCNTSAAVLASRKSASFEPYGENGPTGGGGGGDPGSSNGYILHRKASSDQEHSPTNSDDIAEQPSTDAVLSFPSGSVDSSSWTEGSEEVGTSIDHSKEYRRRGAPIESSMEGDNSNDENQEDGGVGGLRFAMDMMKEVAQLSEYVKKYQQRKENQQEKMSYSTLSTLSENLLGHRRGTDANTDKANGRATATTRSTKPPSPGQDTSTRYRVAVERLESEVADLSSRIESSATNSSSELSGGDESETTGGRGGPITAGATDEENSTRLGINRLKKQKPPPPTFGQTHQQYTRDRADIGLEAPTAAPPSSTSPPQRQQQTQPTQKGQSSSSGESSPWPSSRSGMSIQQSGSSSHRRLTISPPDTPLDRDAVPTPTTTTTTTSSSGSQRVSEPTTSTPLAAWRPHTTQAIRNILKPRQQREQRTRDNQGNQSSSSRPQPRQYSSKSRSQLKALRSTNKSMLDGGQNKGGEDEDYDEEEGLGGNRASSFQSGELTGDQMNPRRYRRANNKSPTTGFAKIINMFESRPKTPVSPPRSGTNAFVRPGNNNPKPPPSPQSQQYPL